MRIVALLPNKLLTQLLDVVRDTHSVYAATDPVNLHLLTCNIDADLVIVDPTIGEARFADAIVATVSALQGTPIVIYTSVSARAMALTLRLAALGVRHLVLYEFDDDPGPFLELIERVPAYPVVELILCELRISMSTIPLRLTRAIELLFKSPSRARTSADLALFAGMTRRSLYRHMASVGLKPRDVIDCARLLRAFILLRAPGSRLKDTSIKLGFARPETLSDLLREWTGHTTRSIHQGVPPDVFVRLLLDHLHRSALLSPAVRLEALEEAGEAATPTL